MESNADEIKESEGAGSQEESEEICKGLIEDDLELDESSDVPRE